MSGLFVCISLKHFYSFQQQKNTLVQKQQQLTLSPSGPGRPKTPEIPMKP